jgi:hypothetical protein
MDTIYLIAVVAVWWTVGFLCGILSERRKRGR